MRPFTALVLGYYIGSLPDGLPWDAIKLTVLVAAVVVSVKSMRRSQLRLRAIRQRRGLA